MKGQSGTVRVSRPSITATRTKGTPAVSAMIPMDLPEPRLVEIPYSEFNRLAIDERYQRIKITDWVDKLR